MKTPIARRTALASIILLGWSTPVRGADETPGFLYVTSYFTDEIYKFDRDGALADVITSIEFDGPEGLAFGPDGTLYIASRDNDQVVGWSEDALGVDVIALAEFDEPIGIAFGPSGNMFVSCAGGGRIVECTLSGVLVRTIGVGSGLSAPGQISFGVDGHLFVADSATDLVFEFDPSGELVRTFDGGSLSEPIGISRAPGGSSNFWVTSLGDDSIDCLDADGSVLATFAHPSLDGPRQMSGGPDGYLYVASDVSDRVVVFDPITQQHIRDIGVGSGINGVGGVAFEPYFIPLRAKGRFAFENDFEKVNQDVALYYAPGTGTLMFAFFSPPVDQPSFQNGFNAWYAVMNGVEQSTDTSMLVDATGIFASETGAGTAHGALKFIGKRTDAGQFKIKSATGSFSRSGFGAQLTVKLGDPPKAAPPK